MCGLADEDNSGVSLDVGDLGERWEHAEEVEASGARYAFALSAEAMLHCENGSYDGGAAASKKAAQISAGTAVAVVVSIGWRC